MGFAVKQLNYAVKQITLYLRLNIIIILRHDLFPTQVGNNQLVIFVINTLLGPIFVRYPTQIL